MRKILPVLAVVPLITGTAMAAQPLTDNQMDTVIAGIANLPLYGPGINLGGSDALSNAQAASQSATPTPTPTPGFTAYPSIPTRPVASVSTSRRLHRPRRRLLRRNSFPACCHLTASVFVEEDACGKFFLC